MKRLEGALTDDEYRALAEETRKERGAVIDRAVADAKQQIDEVPAGVSSVTEIDRIVRETAKRGLEIRQRRELIQHARARQRALVQRERERAIADGGDPRLVATEWVDESRTMKLDFPDHETVFVTVLGFKSAGSYKVSRDGVVVQGPHGQLVFTFNDNSLAGNGSVFRKRSN